ncbi:Mut7-C RNAse domain-containing protein [Sulfurimonas sp. C5]|uniref:Mut7-C RNAse domain-containing protein n=1 Tax=Sulfurimonas sp. C5 TaxID=3036947 RepID=UPI002454048B|nr:Mut7-C RNAse domain-containing protein [Sulfurimonas sp. C5]MDH4944263.1 Mut7-C RNAse domain-containing protein [Sulfurimonas sp. C5]
MNAAKSLKFIADCHLGKLAKYLRMMGFDTLFFDSIDDDDLIELSEQEDRIILTRDKLLHEKKTSNTFYLHSIDNFEQLCELNRVFSIKNNRQKSRCTLCNVTLKEVNKTEILDQVPSKVLNYFNFFEICPKCKRIYWHGSHYKRMMHKIEAI